jgi:hypothetical protein
MFFSRACQINSTPLRGVRRRDDGKELPLLPIFEQRFRSRWMDRLRSIIIGKPETAPAVKPLPCESPLVAYETCMQNHIGVAPKPYEGEFCETEKQSYLNCRKELARK